MLPRAPALRLRTLGLSLAGWTLLALARTLARVAAVPRPPAEAALVFGRVLLISLPWALATPWLLSVAERLSWRTGDRLRTLAVHLAGMAAWTAAESGWAWQVVHRTGPPIEVGPALFFLGRIDQSVFLYLSLVAIGVGLRHRRRLDATLVAGARLEAQLLHARLHVLSLQLHPHFLFNTLTTVSELVHRDARAARGMLASLAELLRRSLEGDTAQEVTLREELALLEPYSRIQRTRFAGTLAIVVEAEPAALTAMVPRLLLQPLVENAIRHGTARRAGPGRVAVRATVHAGQLVLEVEDDGPGPARRGHVREGVGLGNTRARLRELHGDAARLVLLPAAPRGTVARLECPLRSESAAETTADLDLSGEPVDKPSARPPAWRVAAALAAGWVLVGTLGAHEDYLAGQLLGTPDPLAAVLAPRLGEALLWLLLTPLVLWWALWLARRGPSWPVLGAAHLAGAAVAAATHVGLTIELVSPTLAPNLVATVLVSDISVYAALTAAGHAWVVRRLAAEQRAATATLQAELAATRLDLLRWRLRPEFLFRALDRIGMLAVTDPARADELTGRLGELLRLLLPSRDGELVPLSSEVAFLETYLGVAAAIGLAVPRMETSLGAGVGGAPIPGMLLQPLSEVVAPGAGRLVVQATLREGRVALVLRGDAPDGAPGEPAVEELRRRLVRLYGHDCELAVERPAGTTVATLAIPAAGAAWREVA